MEGGAARCTASCWKEGGGQEGGCAHYDLTPAQREAIVAKVRAHKLLEATHERTCKRCDQKYDQRYNNDQTACVYYADEHEGTFDVDWDSDFWYDWNEGCGPPDSEHCRKEYGNEGGYVWSGCGCRNDRDECERSGPHERDDE